MTQYDVAIIGGGIVGSATACYLAKLGFQGSIAIIEKDPTYHYGCTGRSLGGIRQQFSTPENIALSTFTLQLLRRLTQEFGIGADVGFREQGYLVTASPAGLATLRDNRDVQICHGADNILLAGQDLTARFPWLNGDGLAAGCYGLSGEGWLDPYALMCLLQGHAKALGVAMIVGEVTGVTVRGERITALQLATDSITCRHVVNAAGTAAGAIAAMAGIMLPVGPAKRYVYQLDCPAASQALHQAPLTVFPSGLYFRPEGKQFLCGMSPSPQEEPPVMDWEVDYGWFDERLWPELARHVPAFETLKVTSGWVGHYDYNRFDQNAVLGAHPVYQNFYFANGFSGHGLQQGPGVGHALAELIIHGAYRSMDLSRLGFARLQNNMPLVEQNVI